MISFKFPSGRILKWFCAISFRTELTLMIKNEVKFKQKTILIILLLILAGLQSCGGNSNIPVPPIYSPKVYLTDTTNNRVVQLDDMSGNFLYWTTLTGFANPTGVCRYSANGQIFVTDTGNNRVVRVNDITGSGWTVFATSGTDQFSTPSGISVDSFGNVYISDSGNNRIVEIDPAGNWSFFGLTAGGNGTNQFSSPSGIYIDNANRIYVSDTGNNRIVRSDDMVGTNWTTFSGFSSPRGITAAADAFGNIDIYVSDTGNNRVVELNSSGTLIAVFGSNGGGMNQFAGPQGVSVDATGIYVSDTGNNRIVRVNDMTGTGWIELGNYGFGINQFNQPTFAVFQ